MSKGDPQPIAGAGNHRLGRYRGKYAAIWRDDKGTQRNSLGLEASPANREAAETAFQEWLADLRRSSRPEGLITVGKCLDGYFDSHPGVIKRSVIRKHFGAMLPHHIDSEVCKDFTAKRLKAGRSPSTINSDLGILRTALLWAKNEKWIVEAPEIERPAPNAPRDRWLTPAEANRLIAAARAPHVRLFIVLALHTTARAGALLGLTWDRVSFDLNRIDFNEPGRPKTRKRRAVVRMSPELRQALLHAREARLSDFVIEYGGKAVSSVKNGFGKAAGRAKLDDVTPHTLRHTAATWMAQRGVALWEIAGMLGNSVRMVETVYAKHHPDFQSKATAAISEALCIGSAPEVQVNPKTVNKDRKRVKNH